ncbi:MAG: urea carboxylase-associated family protein [Rhodoferax sp.]|nr:urea carboxylase-associated family protein [Rhodoferax sp.]
MLFEPRNQVERIPPQSGRAFKITRGQVLRVTDPFGQQVADLFAFKDGESSCSLSSGRTIDYAGRIYMTKGNVLYANDNRSMFTIVADTVGRHDFLLTPCNQKMFEILYQYQGHHPNCLENLDVSMEEFGIDPHQISTTFNIFMNLAFDSEGGVSVKVPVSSAGDFIELRADMDMVCGLTSCSAENSNPGSFKPIDYQVLTRPDS